MAKAIDAKAKTELEENKPTGTKEKKQKPVKVNFVRSYIGSFGNFQVGPTYAISEQAYNALKADCKKAE